MPKENTHSFFAQNIVPDLEKESPFLAEKIKKNIAYFKMGSYLPDVFFYNEKWRKISLAIHGENGEKTNHFIFHLLKNISAEDEKSVCFLWGILSHFALDITFHPMIFSLTGNFETDPSAEYRHRQFETALNEKLTPEFHLEKNFKKLKSIQIIEKMASYFEIDVQKIISIYQKHYWLNRIFRIKLFYFLALFLSKIKITNRKNLGLFSADPNFHKIFLPNILKHKNHPSGEISEYAIEEMLDKASFLTIKYIKSTDRFLKKEIPLKELANIIKGENLSTGKIENT